jgi:hypothetical protein
MTAANGKNLKADFTIKTNLSAALGNNLTRRALIKPRPPGFNPPKGRPAAHNCRVLPVPAG